MAGRHVVSTRPAPSLWRPAHAVWPDWTFTVGAVPRVPTGLSHLAAGSEGESGGWLARGRGWWAKPGGGGSSGPPAGPACPEAGAGGSGVASGCVRGREPWGGALGDGPSRPSEERRRPRPPSPCRCEQLGHGIGARTNTDSSRLVMAVMQDYLNQNAHQTVRPAKSPLMRWV